MRPRWRCVSPSLKTVNWPNCIKSVIPARVLVGRIYRGRVSKMLPGIESAFIDIGGDRDGFLYLDDQPLTHLDDDRSIERIPFARYLHSSDSPLTAHPNGGRSFSSGDQRSHRVQGSETHPSY